MLPCTAAPAPNLALVLEPLSQPCCQGPAALPRLWAGALGRLLPCGSPVWPPATCCTSPGHRFLPHRHRGVKPSGVVGLSLLGARAGSPPWLSIDLPAGLSWCCSSPAAPAGAGDRWVLLLPSPWLVPPSSSCSSAWLSAASWAPSVGVSTEGVQGSGSPKPPCSLPRVRGSAGGWAPSTGRHHETETS